MATVLLPLRRRGGIFLQNLVGLPEVNSAKVRGLPGDWTPSSCNFTLVCRRLHSSAELPPVQRSSRGFSSRPPVP